jgi:hypothetical protein
MPRGILAIWHDVVPEHSAATLAWYDNEHHFERLGVPGFRSVRRYHAEGGGPFLFIRYETDNVGILSSPAYLERLNQPTPWTLRCQPQFRNSSRTVCRRVERIGAAEGGYAVTIELNAQAEQPDWRAGAEAASTVPGILGWEHWAADLDKSAIPTREKQLRGEDTHVAEVIVLQARGRDEAEAGLKAFTVASPTEATLLRRAGIYRLAFAASNSSL